MPQFFPTPATQDAVKQKLLQVWNSRPGVDEVGDAVDQVTRGVPIPQVMMAGMVLNPKNLRRISKVLKPAFESKVLDDIDKGIIFAKTKYPNLSSIPHAIFRKMLSPGTLGVFDRNTNTATMSEVLKRRGVPEAARRITHELVHAAQLRRGRLPKDVISAADNFDEYLAQAHEAEAYKRSEAAATAVEKIMDFMNTERGITPAVQNRSRWMSFK